MQKITCVYDKQRSFVVKLHTRRAEETRCCYRSVHLRSSTCILALHLVRETSRKRKKACQACVQGANKIPPLPWHPGKEAPAGGTLVTPSNSAHDPTVGIDVQSSLKDMKSQTSSWRPKLYTPDQLAYGTNFDRRSELIIHSHHGSTHNPVQNAPEGIVTVPTTINASSTGQSRKEGESEIVPVTDHRRPVTVETPPRNLANKRRRSNIIPVAVHRLAPLQ